MFASKLIRLAVTVSLDDSGATFTTHDTVQTYHDIFADTDEGVRSMGQQSITIGDVSEVERIRGGTGSVKSLYFN